MTDSTSTPAGWYADPDQPGYERYWDGSQWTEHSQPIPVEGATPAAPAPGAPPSAPGVPPAAPSAEWAPGPPSGAPAPPPNVAPTPPWSGGQSGPGFPPPAASSGGGGNKTALIVAIIVVVAVVAVGAIIALAGGGDDDDTASDSATSQTGDAGGSDGPADPNPDDEFLPPLPPPSDGDEALNALVDDCYSGDMGACDDLYLQAAVGSEYEEYGNTCGGRMPDPRGRFCDGTVEDPIQP